MTSGGGFSHNKVSYRLKFLLIFGMLALVVAVLVFVVLSVREQENLNHRFYNVAESKIAYKANLLNLMSKELKHHLDALKNDAFLEDYLRDPSEAHRAYVQNSFRLILESMQQFFQIRLIDVSGHEEIRLDRDSKRGIVIIGQEALQDKSSRYYTQRSHQLKEGGYYISDFDLNIEHGKIIRPYQPTIRVATPIYHQGVYRGFLIINLLADAVFQDVMHSDFFDIYTIDAAGRYLSHPDPSKQWSAMLDADQGIAQDYPEHVEQILAGMDVPERFLFVYKVDFTDRPFYLLLQLKETVREESLHNIRQMALVISLVLFAAVIPLALIASIVPEKLYRSLIRQSEELAQSMDIIDRHVIYSKTDSSGLITEVSSAFSEISGYPKEELIGHPHSVIRHPDNPTALFTEIWETIRQGETWQGEIRNRNKNGTSYYVYSTIAPEKDEQGDLLGYISIRQDISDKKTVERQQQQLMIQSRHAAMGEMISIIAHQWKQPVNALALASFNLYAEAASKETDLELAESHYQQCDQILQSMAAMIDDFRNFFKPDKHLEEVSLRLMLEEALRFLDHYIQSHEITLEIRIDETITLRCVKNEFEQVLVNIAKNAFDEFASRNIPQPTIRFAADREDDRIGIVIEDNAGGIPQDIMNEIFDPYFSTKSYNGTGVGLYMCKMVVEESLGGRIRAENSDVGARFIIELPREKRAEKGGERESGAS